MIVIVLDFETEFGDDFTLSKMSTEAYIRDPRFQAHGAAVKVCVGPMQHGIGSVAQWLTHEQLKEWSKHVDWSDVFLIAHHCQFDGLILLHHYGICPKMLGCTLSMARLLIGNHISVSLDSVRRHFGMPAKSTPYHLFKNKKWKDLDLATQHMLGAGACDEVESIWKIFCLLMKDFPREEIEAVDLTIKMFSRPTLRADINKLADVWEAEDKRKSERMARLGVKEEQLQSAEQFAALLRAEGVEPDVKDGKKGLIYAFAKNDSFMKELQDDEDERIRELVEARLGAKSTLVQTRAETIGWMARRGFLCIYLRYAGAHTSRWAGGDGSNLQNAVPVINQAILPPDGYLLIKPDAAQVECRLLNFVAGQDDKIADFRNGVDPYVSVAEAFCGHKVTKESHPELRQAGKVVELQAGFGSGEAKIKATLGNKAHIIIDLEEANRFKMAYRRTHPAVEALWRDAERRIMQLAHGSKDTWGPVRIENQRIILPNGIPLIYDTLMWHHPTEEEYQKTGDNRAYWRLKLRSGWTKLYGAKLVENLIQALARVLVSQAMIRIARRGYRIVNMRHDDLWIVIPKDGHEREHAEICRLEMCRAPSWMPAIPLDAEIH